MVEWTEPTRLAGGFTFVEGPVWRRADSCLLFSDIPEARTFRWSATDDLELVRDHNGKANGNTFDAEGRLISCEHETSRVVRWEHDGAKTVLASHFDGRELNSPNDVVVSSDGVVFFTDPCFGRDLTDMGLVRSRELDFAGVYCLTVDGVLRLLSGRCAEPNGLCLNADESELFVNDTASGEILRFRLTWEHGLPRADEGVIWAVIEGDSTGSVDGMKFDVEGNLYCTGPGGVHVLDPAGRSLGVIEVPEKPGNFTWGDDDGLTMFVCATSSLYSVRTSIAGLGHVG